jgi:diguanylate cyclase (GGDEF)-like protein
MAVAILLLLRDARINSNTDTHLFLTILLTFILMVEMARLQLTITVLFSVLSLLALLATALNLLQKAYHDELTGLPGRRALREQLVRISSDYVVAMLDVDHFKKFNDTYGHDVGDQVLKFVAEKMRKVGAGGKIFRYGGEEFTFVFPGKNHDMAAAALDAVREDIAVSKFGMRKKGLVRRNDKSRGRGAQKYVGVTVSIGATEANARQDHYEEAIKRADRALYDAKSAGRNCLQWK